MDQPWRRHPECFARPEERCERIGEYHRTAESSAAHYKKWRRGKMTFLPWSSFMTWGRGTSRITTIFPSCDALSTIFMFRAEGSGCVVAHACLLLPSMTTPNWGADTWKCGVLVGRACVSWLRRLGYNARG